jgi:hypothetical protein
MRVLTFLWDTLRWALIFGAVLVLLGFVLYWVMAFSSWGPI